MTLKSALVTNEKLYAYSAPILAQAFAGAL